MKTNKKDKEKVEWEDIGQEFKYALYNIGNAINRALEKHGKEEKNRKKKRL